jgi:hypothetical protein
MTILEIGISFPTVGTPGGGKGPQARLLGFALHKLLDDGPVRREVLPMQFVT